VNVLKNMEVIFVFAAALGAATSYATAGEPVITLAADAGIVAAKAAEPKMQVVVVAAKRLSAAEKADL
jgi:hypothetical protein